MNGRTSQVVPGEANGRSMQWTGMKWFWETWMSWPLKNASRMPQNRTDKWTFYTGPSGSHQNPVQQRVSQQLNLIDDDSIEDDVAVSSTSASAVANNNSRRTRRRTITDVNLGMPPKRGAKNYNKRQRVLLPPKEYGVKRSRTTLPKPLPPPKQPTFMCPICVGPLVEETSTKCGHIFCKACITGAVTAQTKCPTCRRKITAKGIFRIYLPTTD